MKVCLGTRRAGKIQQARADPIYGPKDRCFLSIILRRPEYILFMDLKGRCFLSIIQESRVYPIYGPKGQMFPQHYSGDPIYGPKGQMFPQHYSGDRVYLFWTQRADVSSALLRRPEYILFMDPKGRCFLSITQETRVDGKSKER